MKRLRNREFAVIGLGRFGSGIALSLEANGHHVLGLDQDPEIVQQLADRITHVAALDATDEKALQAVDITAFDTVIVAIGNDFEANLLTTVSLKNLGVRHIICKVLTRRQRQILLQVGADRAIQPEFDAGQRLADELSAPAILERIPLGPNHSIAELLVPADLKHQSLAQIDLRNRYGVTVLLVKRGNELDVSPPANFVLQPDDLLVVMGSNDRVEAFCHHES